MVVFIISIFSQNQNFFFTCSGFISSLRMFADGSAGAIVAGVIMIIIGVMFAAIAFLDMIMLIKVRNQIVIYFCAIVLIKTQLNLQ